MEKPKQSSSEPQVTEEKYSSTGKPEVTEEKYSSTGKPQVPEEKNDPTGKPQVTEEKYSTGQPRVTEEKYSTGQPQVTEEKNYPTGQPQVTEENYPQIGKPQVTEEKYSQPTEQPAYAVYASDDAGYGIPRTAPDMAMHIALSDTFDVNEPIFGVGRIGLSDTFDVNEPILGYLPPKRNCEQIRVTLRSLQAKLAKTHKYELGPGGKPIISDEWAELYNLIQITRQSLRRCEESPIHVSPIYDLILYVPVVLFPRKPWPKFITLSLATSHQV
jgi:hypothetical protein